MQKAKDEIKKYKKDTQKQLKKLLTKRIGNAPTNQPPGASKLVMVKAQSHKPVLTSFGSQSIVEEESFLQKVKKEYITQKKENQIASDKIDEQRLYMQESSSPDTRKGNAPKISQL